MSAPFSAEDGEERLRRKLKARGASDEAVQKHIINYRLLRAIRPSDNPEQDLRATLEEFDFGAAMEEKRRQSLLRS